MSLANAPGVSAARRTDIAPPVVVYGELLYSLFPNQTLPRGYVVTVVERYPVTAASKRYHALGSVVVNLNHGHAGIVYTVFPNQSAVRSRWNDGLAGAGDWISVDRKVKQSRVNRGTTTIDGNRVQATDVILIEGDTLISAIVTSATASPRDRVAALALARAGLRQLRLLER